MIDKIQINIKESRTSTTRPFDNWKVDRIEELIWASKIHLEFFQLDQYSWNNQAKTKNFHFIERSWKKPSIHAIESKQILIHHNAAVSKAKNRVIYQTSTSKSIHLITFISYVVVRRRYHYTFHICQIFEISDNSR